MNKEMHYQHLRAKKGQDRGKTNIGLPMNAPDLHLKMAYFLEEY